MPCPRCQAEVDPCARVCPACALPLALGDEPAPVPLARTIALDRRAPGRSAAPVRPDRARHVDLDAAPDRDCDLDASVHRDAGSERDPARALSVPREPSAGAAGAASKGPDLAPGPAPLRVRLRRATASPALHLLASVALDGLLVLAAAAVPLAVASSGAAAAPGALAALALPAAGFVALVGAAYVLLSRALLGATPGRLAVARVARGGGPPGGARGGPLDVRAP